MEASCLAGWKEVLRREQTSAAKQVGEKLPYPSAKSPSVAQAATEFVAVTARLKAAPFQDRPGIRVFQQTVKPQISQLTQRWKRCATQIEFCHNL